MIEKHLRNIGFFMCSDGRHTDVRTVIIDKFFSCCGTRSDKFKFGCKKKSETVNIYWA